MLPIYGFGCGFGIGPRFVSPQQRAKRPVKKVSGPRRAGPGYIQGRGQARGTSKWSSPD
jgi:hypothetical protein